VNRSSKRSSSQRSRAPYILQTVAALIAFAAFGPGAQAAKPRVGVAMPEGATGHAVGEAISATLAQHGYEVVEVDAEDSSKRCQVQVYSASGDAIGKASWAEKSMNKLASVVGHTLWARVGDVLTKAADDAAAAGGPKAGGTAKAGGDDESASAEAPDKKNAHDGDGAGEGEGEGDESPRRRKHVAVETTEAASAAPSGSAGTALDLAVGMRLFSRNLAFSPGGTALRDFSVSGRSALGLAGAWYPAASYRADWLSNLGVGAAVEWLPGLDSTTSGGVHYPTTAADLRADVRYRLMLSGGSQIAFAVGGGQQSFVFRSDGTAQRSDINYLPDVQYSYMRVGVDARFVLPANLSLLVAGGYRYVPSAGNTDYLIQQSSYLPSSSVVAFDVGAGVGYRLMSAVEARAGFDLRRYQLSTDATGAMATSASDQYTAFWLQVAILLDGAGATEDHATAKPRHDDESE
jgi:methylmalonyl-CoA mutase cobalamin-binding subunit